MLQTSQDLLFIVIAIAVLWLTIFLSIVLYYLLAIAKEGSNIIKDWKERFKKIDEVVNLIKGKIERSISSFAVLAEAIKQIVEFLKIKKQTKKK